VLDPIVGRRLNGEAFGNTRQEVIRVSVSINPHAPAPKRPAVEAHDARSLDQDSRGWLRTLRASGATRDQAIARLHALLLRAASFEVARRRPRLPHLRDQLDEIALEAADDALISVLARLDDFRGDSRFTTWAYKFAVLNAAVKLRKRAWQGREVPLEPETWSLFASLATEPADELEQRELLSTLQTGIGDVLTPRQRRVFVALALNDVPIDVLADRLNTTRGALYKTLHDARRNLRTYLAQCGFAP
jgi:RNA polymerase sigma-70 factor (ECF subfamily)